MNTNELQEQRLDFLLKEFEADAGRDGNIEIPHNMSEKQKILRALMNVRMPKKMPDDVIKLQDEYLRGCIEEKGIVTLGDIPVIRDITRLKVDAIVNAANSQMLGCFIPLHTCIDNQVHTFAGIQLREECDQKMEKLREKYGRDYEQPTAIPMLTEGYNLPAKKVVHIVGPIVSGVLTSDLEKDLADCYTNTLDMCMENNLKSIAFCCISTGVFHFPNKRAAEIAVSTVEEWLKAHPDSLERVIFNVFKDEDKKYYEELLW